MMQQPTAVEPARLTIADLEVLEAKALAPVPAAPPRPLIAKRDARQQMVGMMRMINHFSGGDMREEINTIDFLTRKNDELEAELAKLRAEFEAEKGHYRKALQAVGTVLEAHVNTNPYEGKAPSKVKRTDLDIWAMAVAESITWAMKRTENALLPSDQIEPIAADPEV